MRCVADAVTVKWCLDNSISSQVTTPVSAADLASALISALESSTVSPVAATNDVTFDILLAEDNLVNQKLAVKILEKYGHVVEIAENGSLAVEAFKARVQKNRPFDIILVSVIGLQTAAALMRMDLSRWTSPCHSWEAWKPQSISGLTRCSMTWIVSPSLR
jgi:PleD family two-component response regulator